MNDMWTPHSHMLGGCHGDGKNSVEGKPHDTEPRLQSGQSTVSVSVFRCLKSEDTLLEAKL
jgi:hypothetical protein